MVWRPRWRPTGTPTGARCRRSGTAASSAGCHGPSSTRTSTASMPRCLGPGHAGDRARVPASTLARPRGVSMRDIVLIGPCLRPAALDPVLVEVVEGRQLDLGHPLGGRHVAVEAGHDEAGGEAVLDGQRLAVHADGEHGVAAVHHGLHGGAGGAAVDRAADDLVGAGLHAGLVEQRRRAARRASGRCRRSWPPTSLETQVRVMSRSTISRSSRSSKVSSIVVDHAADAERPGREGGPGAATRAVSTR